jgi:hypothetical protein
LPAARGSRGGEATVPEERNACDLGGQCGADECIGLARGYRVPKNGKFDESPGACGEQHRGKTPAKAEEAAVG